LIDGTSGLPKGRDEALNGLEAEKVNDKIVQGQLNAIADMQGAHSEKTQHARVVYQEKDQDKVKPAAPGGAAHNVWNTLAAARGAAVAANGGGKPFSMADAAMVTARAKHQEHHKGDANGEGENGPAAAAAASAGAGGASFSSSSPSLNAAAAPKVGGAALIGGSGKLKAAMLKAARGRQVEYEEEEEEEGEEKGGEGQPAVVAWRGKGLISVTGTADTVAGGDIEQPPSTGGAAEEEEAAPTPGVFAETSAAMEAEI
jgi:hypothetical protein